MLLHFYVLLHPLILHYHCILCCYAFQIFSPFLGSQASMGWVVLKDVDSEKYFLYFVWIIKHIDEANEHQFNRKCYEQIKVRLQKTVWWQKVLGDGSCGSVHCAVIIASKLLIYLRWRKQRWCCMWIIEGECYACLCTQACLYILVWICMYILLSLFTKSKQGKQIEW